MTYFKIEKDVPIPVTAGRPAKYLQILNQMIRNDSIAVPSNAIGSVRSSARKVGIKIITRKENETTFRVWRIN